MAIREWLAEAATQGFPLTVTIRISRDAEDSDPRHLAYTEEAPNGSLRMVFSPRLARQSDDTIDGVIIHEIGHAIDFAYEWAEMWRERNEEVRADLIAETVFGVPVRYDPTTLIQTLGPGIKRPRGLK